MRKILIIFLFLLFSISIKSGVYAEDFWTHYTKPDEIRGIAIDGNYIWCNTSGGVVRWDKRDSSYVKYTAGDGLIENGGTPISIGLDGLVWCGYGGYSGGVSYFDGEEWVNFKPTGGINLTNNFHDIWIDNNGSVWFGTLSGIICYKDYNWIFYNPSNSDIKNQVRTLVIDHDGVLWCGYGYYGVGVSSFDGEQWQYYTVEAGLDNKKVYDIYVDENNIKWFTSSIGEVTSFNGTVWKTWTSEDGLADITIYRITGDNNCVLWFGTENGISSFDGSEYINYPFESELSNQYTSAIAVDTDNNVWCGTKKGLACFDGTGWKVYKEKGGHRSLFVDIIAIDKENTKWIGGSPDVGISYFDNTSWVYSRYTDNGDVLFQFEKMADGMDFTKWFLIRQQVFSFDGNNWLKYENIDNLKSIAVDQDNILWCAGSDGVYSFDGVTWEHYDHENYGLFGAVYHCLVDQKNLKWFGLKSKGIASFNGETWNQYTAGDRLIDNNITVMEVDHNNVKWIGHDAGVSSYDDVSFTDHTKTGGPVSTIYTIKIGSDNKKWVGAEDGLWSFDDTTWRHYSGNEMPQGFVKILAVDTDNTVWMRVDVTQGVVHFDGKEAKYFTKENGLISNFVKTIAIDHDGVKWIGTDEGISTYKKDTSTFIDTYNEQPEAIPVLKSYPNPFNPLTTIKFTLPEAGFTTLTIYSISGQKVRELAADYLTAGTHSFTWDGIDDSGKAVSSGVYITRLKAGKHTATGRMVLMR